MTAVGEVDLRNGVKFGISVFKFVWASFGKEGARRVVGERGEGESVASKPVDLGE